MDKISAVVENTNNNQLRKKSKIEEYKKKKYMFKPEKEWKRTKNKSTTERRKYNSSIQKIKKN